MKRILLIDNYDSFTYNLYHLLYRVWGSGHSYVIRRNRDRGILELDCDLLVISPGPMRPEDTGLLSSLFSGRIVKERIPALGICLGMQFMAACFGARIIRAARPVHGRRVAVEHAGSDLFRGIRPGLQVMRYNSLEAVDIPDESLEVLARETGSGSVMALRHRRLPLAGLQFHPESFLAEEAERLLKNFWGIYVENRL